MNEKLCNAGFWERMTRQGVIVEKNGLKAGRIRRNLRQLYDLIPYIAVGIYGWLKGAHFNDLDSFSMFIVFFLPQLLLAGAIWNAPIFLSKSKRSIPDRLAGTFVVCPNDGVPSKGRIFRGVLLTCLLVLILIFLSLGSAWVLYNTPDRPLNPEVETFFHKDPFNPDSNFFVAWTGMNAPSGEKDLYAYGLNVINEKIDTDKEKGLHFKGDVTNLCYRQDELEKNKKCLTSADIAKLFQDNEELVSRYRALYGQTYKTYSVGDKFAIHGSGQDIIDLQRLLAAQWIQLTKNGQGKDVMEQWLLTTQSEKRVLEGKMDLVEHAIWMIVYGTNHSVLPVILEKDPSLIPLYKDKITAVLDYDYMKAWNIEDTIRANLNWQYSSLIIANITHDNLMFKPNDTRNNFLQLSKEMVHLAKLPVQAMPSAYQELSAKYGCGSDFNWRKMLVYNAVWNIMSCGQVAGGQMFINAYRETAKQRALIIWINAKSQNISRDGMPEYLSHSASSLYDPLTDSPFKWDSKKNSIYYEWKGEHSDLYY